MRSMPSIIAAGGAAPATIAVHAVRRCPRFSSAGALTSMRVHDRRAAVVRDAVRRGSASKIGLRLDLAQADVGARARGDRPREAPAVAVEHRQRPQVDRRARGMSQSRMLLTRVQVGAAVVVDHALRVAGRARGVVQRDRVPFVGGRLPRELRVALARGAPRSRSRRCARPAGVLRVVDVDHERLRVRERRSAFAIVGENSRSVSSTLASPWSSMKAIASASSRVLSVLSTRAGHRHAEVRLDHRRRVGQHRRHRVADADAARRQRRCEPARSARRSRPRCSARAPWTTASRSG